METLEGKPVCRKSDREPTPPARISAILFDLDNTLIQTRKSDVLTAKMVADLISSEYDIPLTVSKKASDKFLKKFRGCVEDPRMTLKQWRTMLWIEALGDEYEDLAEVIYAEWKKLRYRNLAIPEKTQTLLKKLRNQYQLALVTNGPSNSQWEKIKQLGLAEFFDSIVVSGDLKWEKPQPEIFHRVCNNLGVQPFECLIVGDRIETDIKGGFAAQLGITVWLPISMEESSSKPPNPAPDFTISEISQLLGILQRGNEKLKPKGPNRALKGRSSVGPGTSPGSSSAALPISNGNSTGATSPSPVSSPSTSTSAQNFQASPKPASDAED